MVSYDMSETEWINWMLVLILVVMEDGLVRLYTRVLLGIVKKS